MKAKVRLKKHHGGYLLRVEGDVTINDIASISQRLDAFRGGEPQTLVVDLTNTTFIDSHGLGMFVFYWKILADAGVDIVFLNPQGFVKDLFQTSNLEQVFRVVERIEDV